MALVRRVTGHHVISDAFPERLVEKSNSLAEGAQRTLINKFPKGLFSILVQRNLLVGRCQFRGRLELNYSMFFALGYINITRTVRSFATVLTGSNITFFRPLFNFVTIGARNLDQAIVNVRSFILYARPGCSQYSLSLTH